MLFLMMAFQAEIYILSSAGYFCDTLPSKLLNELENRILSESKFKNNILLWYCDVICLWTGIPNN